MEFTIKRDIFFKSLSHAYGIIEKKATLPILSNILIAAEGSKIKITATDLDIIYSEVIPLEELKKEGSTTTSASVLYDILKKLESEAKVELILQSENKLKLISGNSKFNLLCIPSDNFPLSEEDIDQKTFDRRMKSIEKFEPKINKGYLGRYARLVTSANTGAVLK